MAVLLFILAVLLIVAGVYWIMRGPLVGGVVALVLGLILLAYDGAGVAW